MRKQGIGERSARADSSPSVARIYRSPTFWITRCYGVIVSPADDSPAFQKATSQKQSVVPISRTVCVNWKEVCETKCHFNSPCGNEICGSAETRCGPSAKHKFGNAARI